MGLLSYLPGGKKFEKYTGAPSFGKIAAKLSKDGGFDKYNNADGFSGQRGRSLQDVLTGLLLGLVIGQQLGHAQGQQDGGCCRLHGGFQQPYSAVNIHNGGGFTFASYSSSINRYLGC